MVASLHVKYTVPWLVKDSPAFKEPGGLLLPQKTDTGRYGFGPHPHIVSYVLFKYSPMV
jgi:hypothetical protein